MAAAAFQSVRARMLFLILVVVVPIYALASWSSYNAISRRLEADALADADQLAERLAVELDARIRPIEGAIRTIAFQLEETDPPRKQYLEHIRGLLGAWPDVYGSTIAVEVNSLDDRPFAPYLFRKGGEIGSADLAQDGYGYRTLPWYRSAADGRRTVWSEPYFDKGGGEAWMVTYSAPYYRRPMEAGRALGGVVTADLEVDWLKQVVAGVKLGRLGFGWLSSGKGAQEFIAPIGDTGQRLARFDAPLDEAAVRQHGASMLAQGFRLQRLPAGLSTKPAYLAVGRLNTLGWNLSMLVPRDELLAEARAQMHRQVVLGLVGLAGLVFAVSLVAAGISRPIHELAESVGKAGMSGNAPLHFKLPARAGRDEVGVLTEALRNMRDSLQEHVQLRAESLAEQARLEQELSISAQIQQSMLPHGESARSVPGAIDIAATLVPARQVGGDLYDYFPVSDGRLLFMIADVSDKGIPAALFMARMSALARVLAASGGSPEQVLAQINARLCEGNDACMFVTAGCGLLDPQSGALRYASAGHEAPLLRTVEGAVRVLAVEAGAAIGFDADARYELLQGSLAPGDTLLLFTDGLSEAQDSAGGLFGVERVEALLREAGDARPEALVARAIGVVVEQTEGFHQTDDLTVMALSFVPADATPRKERDGAGWLIAVEPSQAGLRHAQQRLRGILAARGVDGELRHDIELVVEEWLTNVLKAAAPGALKRVSMDVLLTSGAIQLTFRDDGEPFNPLEAEGPDLDMDIGDRPVGGLGLHLVRQTARRCDYAHADGCNALMVELLRNG